MSHDQTTIYLQLGGDWRTATVYEQLLPRHHLWRQTANFRTLGSNYIPWHGRMMPMFLEVGLWLEHTNTSPQFGEISKYVRLK